MIVEIHAHSSVHSDCSIADPVAIVRQARKKGAQGVIITEHHYQWSGEEIDALREKSEIDNSFVILAAQEVETDIGHVLVYGADETAGKGTALTDLRQRFPEAALVWAHPFRGGKVPSREELTNPLLDAVEIFNINQTPMENYLGLKLWHEYKFTALAGTDAHDSKDVAIFSTQVLHPVTNIKEFALEVKRGRCIPFVKEIPKSGSNVVLTEIIMGTKGTDEVRNRLITKQFYDEKKWQTAKKSFAIREKLYSSGFAAGKYRVPKTLDVNETSRLIIEEGQRGDILFDTLAYVAPEIGSVYFNLSAEWLAKLHLLKLRTESLESSLKREEKRFDSYLRAFSSTNSPYLGKAEKFLALLREEEKRIFLSEQDVFVQCHGDYHPKNVIIGQDRMRDISTLFISVIDFDNSIFMPPEFDVGYFISQLAYQFHDTPHVLEQYTENNFIKTYTDFTRGTVKGPDRRVQLFKLRGNMSIASFLIKVGKGVSEDMEFIISESKSIYSSLSGYAG